MLAMALPGCRVLAVKDVEDRIVVVAEGTADKQACPVCGYESTSVNSRYVRRPQDLPIQSRNVRLQLITRRWLCKNRACSRTTFCESFPDLVGKHGQRTERVTSLLRRLILAISSTKGSSVARGMGIEVSPSTLLRTVDSEGVQRPTPRVLGVDEFALAKGRTYNTLLVDLESGKPVDILAGRTKETLLEWLRGRSGIEIVARDRASAYADAIREGAPKAIQVADRFHLVKNLTDALREVVDQQRWALPEPTSEPVPESEPPPAPPAAPPPPKRMTRHEQRKAAAADRLRRRYEEVHQLHSSGLSAYRIHKMTGLDRHTIAKYLNSSEVPKRAEMRRRPSLLDPYADYLSQRWRAGYRNARVLYEEIVQQGYGGSLQTLYPLLRTWKAAAPPSPSEKPSRSGQKKGKRNCAPSWKAVRSAMLCLPEHLRDSQHQLLQDFLALHPKLALGRDLVAEFRRLLRDHDVAAFDGWLVQAAQSGLAPFERLARTLNADGRAVRAAIELPWSTGPVEGHITRIKLIKRIGYGRAGLNLLRARILAC